jgi:hypothetical protein
MYNYVPAIACTSAYCMYMYLLYVENAELYNVLIRVWGESTTAEAPRRLKGVLENMRFSGIPENIDTFKTLIRVNSTKSVAYFEEMIESGFEPDIDDVSIWHSLVLSIHIIFM